MSNQVPFFTSKLQKFDPTNGGRRNLSIPDYSILEVIMKKKRKCGLFVSSTRWNQGLCSGGTDSLFLLVRLREAQETVECTICSRNEWDRNVDLTEQRFLMMSGIWCWHRKFTVMPSTVITTIGVKIIFFQTETSNWKRKSRSVRNEANG